MEVEAVRRAADRALSDLSLSLNVSVVVLALFVLLFFVPLPVSPETFEWLLTARADPSPGWLFAPLVHAGVFHLISNVGQLLYFGIVPERRLSTREYLGFLGATGVLTTLIQVVQYNVRGIEGGIVGASGATMAVMGFAVGHLGLSFAGRVDRTVVGSRRYRVMLFLMGCLWAAVQIPSDFIPGVSVGMGPPGDATSSGVAHLSGFLLGVGYAVRNARHG